MALTTEQVISTKRAAEERLLAIPGVHAVGVGHKTTGGRDTGELCIAVFVVEKKPLAEIPDAERIPPEVDGVPVDVVETPQATRHADTSKYRPVKGGCQIEIASGLSLIDGTLGCLVKITDSGKTALLTNEHVVETLGPNGIVTQPSATCNCCDCCPAAIANLTKKVLSSDLDGATCTLQSSIKWDASIIDIGGVQGTATVALQQAVRKRGRTTLLTNGTVGFLDLSGTRTDGWKYTGQIGINPSGSNPFSSPGDSGSVVVDASVNVVGLLWGGNDDNMGFASPIANAVAQLGIQILTSTAVAVAASEDRANREVLARAVEREVGASAKGRQIIAFYERHAAEVNALVNRNWRVTAVWHRNSGPEIARAVLAVASQPEDVLPAELDGRPLGACIDDVVAALMKYGSEELRRDLVRLNPHVERFAGLSYARALEELDAISREEAAEGFMTDLAS